MRVTGEAEVPGIPDMMDIYMARFLDTSGMTEKQFIVAEPYTEQAQLIYAAGNTPENLYAMETLWVARQAAVAAAGTNPEGYSDSL